MKNDLKFFKVGDQPQTVKPDDTGTKSSIIPVVIIIYAGLYLYYKFY